MSAATNESCEGALVDYPVLDTRGDQWTVFRPPVRRFENLACAIHLAILGALFMAGGVVSIVDGQVWKGVIVCAVGLGLWVLQHGLVWSYYVAIDERHLVAGRVRSRGIDIVERSKIASVTWRADSNVHCGVLWSADGVQLLALGQWLAKRQVAEIAELLGVAFTVTRPRRTRDRIRRALRARPGADKEHEDGQGA